MDKKFRWNMFITSFIPLWFSIFVADIWCIMEYSFGNWSHECTFINNIKDIIQENIVCFLVVLIILVLLITGICSINRFLKEKCSNRTPPKIRIKKVLRANKLSSEFLLAYILPQLKSVALFVIYFSVLAYLCIRNNNVYTNIWLEFKGYKMFFCDLETEILGKTYTYKDCLVISKNNLMTQIDKDMSYWDFDNYIYIDLR